MGKRSDYERVPQDLYETPMSAVTALLPWFEPATRFVEPCVGRGALVGHLKRAEHVLVAAYDLPDDAGHAHYAAFEDGPKDLHTLLANISNQTTLRALLQHDWLANLGSGEMAPRAGRIVPVGRVKFIPDSPHSGMENVVWVKFTRPSDEPTVFVFRNPQANARPRLGRRPGPYRRSRVKTQSTLDGDRPLWAQAV